MTALAPGEAVLRSTFFCGYGLAALLLTSGCDSVYPRPAPLRVGINAWPGYETLFLAQEKGFYRDEGVDVRIVELSSLADARRAYERGQIDLLASSAIEVLQIRGQSVRSPQIVQVVDYSDGADVILARAPIENGAALRGRRIGVELASLGVYVLARGLERHGLGLRDVEMVAMDQLSMEAALRAGELDALVTYPPTSIKLLRDGAAHVVFSTAEIPGEVIDVISVERALNETRAEDVAKLLRAFHRAVDYARDQPEDAYRIMAAREGITAQELAAALADGIKLVGPNEQEAFLGSEGRIHDVVRTFDRLLRQTGQLKGPDRRAGIATDAYTRANGSP